MARTDKALPTSPPVLATIPVAARLAGVGQRQLRRATRNGEIVTYMVGGWPRVRWADVVEWIEGQRVAPRGSSHSAKPGA